MSHSTPPRLRQLVITDFIGPSTVPSQEVYIAPNAPNAPKKKPRLAPNAVPAVPVVRPPYMKPKELVRTLFPLVHMRQINPRKFTRDGRYKSNPNIPLFFFDVVDLTAIPDHILEHKPLLPFSDWKLFLAPEQSANLWECTFDCRGAAVNAIRQRAFLIIALAFADIENTEN